MSLFNNQNQPQRISLKKQQYEYSRKNLLFVIGLTAINIILSLVDSDLYFLFSARFPIYLTGLGQYYKEETGVATYLTLLGTLAILSLLLYLPCYFLAKKSRVWMLVAAILFSFDTLFLLYIMSFGVEASYVIDILFHIYVLFSLYKGYANGSAINEKEPEFDVVIEQAPDENAPPLYGYRDIPPETTQQAKIVKPDTSKETEVSASNNKKESKQ